MSRRDAIQVLGLGALGLLLVDCRDPVTPDETGAEMLVPVNGADPLLLRAVDRNHRTVDYVGRRDSSGRAIALDRILIDGDSGAPLRFDLLGDGRPGRMTDGGGTAVELSWVSPTRAAATVRSRDGQSQLNTTVDFASGAGAGPEPTHPQGASHSRRAGSAPPLLDPDVAGAGPPAAIAEPFVDGSTVRVRVTQCGMPVTYPLDVSVNVSDESGSPLGSFPALYGGNGYFHASVPTALAPTLNPADICDSIAQALNGACTFLEAIPTAPIYLCTSLSAAVLTNPITAAFAAEIAAACASLSAGMELYCATLNASPAQGVPSLADRICQASVLNRTFVGNIRLVAAVSALPSDYRGPAVTVPGNGAIPDLAVDMGSVTSVRSLRLEPPNPIVQQGYVGVARIHCLPAGTTVTMSVSGTDGYSDSDTYTVGNAMLENTYQLAVPGAASAGIRDVVTVTVRPPGAAAVSLTASVVFS